MKINDIKEKWKQYQYVALVIGLGVALLLWPEQTQQPEEETSTAQISQQTIDITAMEQQMEEVLGYIDGVGQVCVMLSLEAVGTTTLAKDSTLSYSGTTQSPEDYSRSDTVIVVTQEGEETGLVLGQTYPVFRGALVVCQGGQDPTVRLAVTQGVAALTGLGTDRITVATWESSFGGGST